MMGRLTTDPTCPDCGAKVLNRHLAHDDTCPLATAGDRVREADRDWFAARPGATTRRRPVSKAEIAELRMAGRIPDGCQLVGEIEVVQIAPGVRIRRLVDAYAVAGGVR